MKNESKLLIATICIIVPILLSILLYFKGDLLIPKGYELAIDGYVISKTLILIFLLHLLSKLGYFLHKNTTKD